MAAERARSRGASRPIFYVVLAWFVVLIGAGAGLVAANVFRAEVLIGLGVALAVAPISLIAAWKWSQATDSLQGDVKELTRAMQTVTQESGLSEGAKRVLHRRQERELLRRAIEQDMADRDFDAAMVLVKELAERFGYRSDAEEFRTKIERARAQSLDSQVIDSLGDLDELIRRQQWVEAYAEAARITRLFPDSHRVHGLRDRVDQARAQYRKELERRFLEAAHREQIDLAMELLRELDQYLTPTEAEPLAEVARGVVSKSRENLGVRFKLMVQDHQWDEAIRVGDQIIQDFPNTKMATEVRQLMPVLHDRSTGRAKVG